MLQNLKCRTPDHWRRRGEFVDIAEQCSNTTSGDRSTATAGSSGQDNDYFSGNNGDRRTGNRRNTENVWGNDDSRRNGDNRRQNNRGFSVMRQDFASNGDRGGDNNGDGSRGNNGNRGHNDDHSNNRGNDGDRDGYGSNGNDRGDYGGNGGDRDSTSSCDVRQQKQPQYYSPVSATFFFSFTYSYIYVVYYPYYAFACFMLANAIRQYQHEFVLRTYL